MKCNKAASSPLEDCEKSSWESHLIHWVEYQSLLQLHIVVNSSLKLSLTCMRVAACINIQTKKTEKEPQLTVKKVFCAEIYAMGSSNSMAKI